MKSTKRFIFLIIVLILGAGCGVSTFKAQNWNPNDPSSDFYRSRNLDICRQQAQQPEAKTDLGVNYGIGGASKYPDINKPHLISCMEAKGYKLRDLTGTETFINLVTSPVVFPLMIFGKSFDDVY